MMWPLDDTYPTKFSLGRSGMSIFEGETLTFGGGMEGSATQVPPTTFMLALLGNAFSLLFVSSFTSVTDNPLLLIQGILASLVVAIPRGGFEELQDDDGNKGALRKINLGGIPYNVGL